MSGPSDGGGGRTRLEDALVFQIDERDIELMEVEEEADDLFARRFARSLDETSALWKQDVTSGTGTSDPFARINEMQNIVAILRACLPEAKNLIELDDALVRVADQAGTLARDGAGFSQFDPRTRELEVGIADIQDALVEAERKLPISWLQHRMDELDFGDAALAHYLRFQIENLKIAPTSISRIDLVVSRLAARRNTEGVLEIRPPGEVAQLISGCMPRSTTPAHVRNNAVLFFRNAAERMRAMAYVDEFFESGLYVDILGYKLSLRHEYFDPRLLYAAAELNIAMENWVQELGMSIRVLDPYFAEGREKVRKILNRNLDGVDSMTERWNREFSGEMRLPMGPRRSPGSAATKSEPSSLPWRKLIAIVAIVVALIFIAPTAIEFVRGSSGGLTSASESETRAISEILVEGSWAGESPNRMFIGYVDPDTWRAQSNETRGETARAIRDQLGFRDVERALVYMRLGRDETLVVHIVSGELRYVQPHKD